MLTDAQACALQCFQISAVQGRCVVPSGFAAEEQGGVIKAEHRIGV
jgi:hypothetical protein